MALNYREMVLGEEFADLIREPVSIPLTKVDYESHGEELIENLNAQLALYTLYLDQANRQRMSLVNHNLSETSAANVEAEKLIGLLSQLEKVRLIITRKLVPDKNDKDLSLVKCETLYPLLSMDNAARLKACRDALVIATKELKSVLDVSNSLAENGSRIIHTTIGIMTSVVGRTNIDKISTYTSKGSIRMGKLQIRNLINRSV